LTALVQLYVHEPVMISQLVRIAIASIAVSATWEALEYPQWEDQHLEKLQTLWQQVDFLDDLAPSLAMERALCIPIYGENRGSSAAFEQILTGSTSKAAFSDLADKFVEDPKVAMRSLFERYPGHWIWKWWWSYDDELWYWRQMQDLIEAARAMARSGVYASISPALTNLKANLVESTPRFMVGNLLLPGNDRLVEKIARAETQRRMVIAAIALKRFHLRHGRYPEKLSALVPEFLPAVPADFMDGQPLRYRLNADGTYTLYSIGDDGKDDGGDPRPKETIRSHWWMYGRDWVWPRPATPQEVKAAEDAEQKR